MATILSTGMLTEQLASNFCQYVATKKSPVQLHVAQGLPPLRISVRRSRISLVRNSLDKGPGKSSVVRAVASAAPITQISDVDDRPIQECKLQLC